MLRSSRIIAPVALSVLALLAGCSSNNGITHPHPPPGGSFSASNLNGTYVFSVVGTDAAGAPYAMAGTFTADGQGGIGAGAVDINDVNTSVFTSGPLPNQSVNSGSSYNVQVDGRGILKLNTSTPFQQIVFDFVLADSTHGMISEFDGSATSSGSFDLQSSGVTPTGAYAFNFFGFDYSGGVFATAGNFTLGSGGTISGGLEDFNDNGLPYAGESLGGTVVLGPSSTPGTTLTPSGTFGTSLVYDVFAIDASHLKFIEMDQFAATTGDAFSQGSPTMPTGTLAFTLAGENGGNAAAAGGFMITDGSGGISNTSTEDINNAGSVSSSPAFTANYTASGTGRYIINNFSGFFGGTEYVAYPSSGGVLLLEMDTNGLMTGTGYLQSGSATFNESAGYALSLSGVNLSVGVEVDEIAEFASNSNGTTVQGVIDENYQPNGGPSTGLALNGTYALPDSNGRGSISANAGSSTNSTLNGGFAINYYLVDGVNFPFVEVDQGGGQVAAGIFSIQNASASSSAAVAKSHLSVFRPSVRPAAKFRKQK